MWEIYWLTRLDGMFKLCEVSTTIFIIIIFLLSLGCVTASGEDKEILKKLIKALKLTIAPLIISILGLVFIPSTSEALLIFGLGATIDYLKTNDKVQQLPDKCINALDAWVESLSEEKDKK